MRFSLETDFELAVAPRQFRTPAVGASGEGDVWSESPPLPRVALARGGEGCLLGERVVF